MVDWRKALEEINLIEYFKHKFPNFYYDNNRKAFVDNSDPSLRTNKFCFFKGKDGHLNYIERAGGNGGNLIHFIKNEIIKSNSNIWVEINKELLDYNKFLETATHTQKFNNGPTIDQSNLIDENINSNYQVSGKFFRLHEHQLKYLTEDRMISLKTLQSNLFKDTFLSYKSNHDQFYTLGIKIFDKDRNKIIGVNKIATNKDYHTYNSKLLEKGSMSNIGFSMSNAIDGAKEMVITESYLDAASHWELNPNIKREYYSTNGELSQNKAHLFKDIFNNKAFKTLVLANDNDSKGHLYDTLILSHFIPETKLNYRNNNVISVTLNTNNIINDESFNKMLRTFKSLNENNIKIINNLLDKEDAKEFILKENSIFFVKKTEDQSFEFIIPNTKEYLSEFNQNLLKLYPSIENKVVIQKSITKDWNQDLKDLKNNQTQKVKNQLKL